jgi:hypothetical protein
MFEKLVSFWIYERKEERKSQKTHKKGIFLICFYPFLCFSALAEPRY